jgi:hypothetical protein
MDDFEPPGGEGKQSEAFDADDEEGRRHWRGMFQRSRREGQRANTVSDGVTQPVSGRPQGFSSSYQTVPSLNDTRQAMACPPTFEPQSQSRQSQGVPSLVAERDEKHLPFGDESSFEALQRDPDFIQQQQAILDQIMVDRSQSHQAVLPDNRSRASIMSNESSRTASTRFNGRQEESTLDDFTKAAWNDTSQESSDDFLQYLNDPDVVEEQRRMLENVRSEASQSRIRHSASSYYEPSSLSSDTHQGTSSFSTFLSSAHSSSTRRANDEMLGYMEEAAASMSLPPPRQGQDDELLVPPVRSVSEPNVPTGPRVPPMPRHSFSETLSRSPMTSMTTTSRVNEKDAGRPYTTQCEQDALVELYQGKKIQVRGTNHTWKSIAKGKATLVQCPVCFTILQVGLTAKLLFCTKCSEVSPIGIHDSTTDFRADGLIAIVVQQQEVDVALAKKMARNASNK